MDRQCPSYYVDSSPESSIIETQALISHIRSLPNLSRPLNPDLVQPILTPRFAISCSPSLLSSLGDLASTDPSLHIQTHISENKAEVAFVRELFPTAKNYADVYDSFGLLRNNTVLAHAVHLEDAEMDLIKERRAGISHCPTSNFNLSSGVAPIGRYLDKGIKVTFLIRMLRKTEFSLFPEGRSRIRCFWGILAFNPRCNPPRQHRIEDPRDECRCSHQRDSPSARELC